MRRMMKPAATIFSLFAGATALALLSGCDLLTVSQTGRHIREGNEAVARGELQRAVERYESALDGTMLSAEAHYRLGLLYEDKIKNPVGALHHFERYLELAPQGQFATDVKGYVDRLRLTMVSSLSEGTVMPAKDAMRLKNENLELQRQVAELRKAVPAGVRPAGAVRSAGAAPGMVVAATPPPAESAPAAEPEVRRAVPVGPVHPTAPQAEASQPAAAGGEVMHTVAKGETLAGIARKYYGNASQWPKIAEANKDTLPDPTKLKLGQVLKIPPK